MIPSPTLFFHVFSGNPIDGTLAPLYDPLVRELM